MRLDTAILGSLLFGIQHVAGSVDFSSDVHRRHMNIHGGLRARGFDRRQAASPTSTPTAQGMDLATWNAQVESACMSSLSALNGVASNSAGMAVCYNVPFFDNKTGVFEAELRMYNISAPTAEWTGVTASNMMVALAYLGATVQRTNGTIMGVQPNVPLKAKREATVLGVPLERIAALEARQSTMPVELKVLTYVGKVNSNVLGPQFNQYVTPLLSV